MEPGEKAAACPLHLVTVTYRSYQSTGLESLWLHVSGRAAAQALSDSL